MSPEITVMGGELGNVFWDLPPWIVYAPGYDLGCTIYVANPTDTEKEYTLMSRLSSNGTVISDEAVKVFGFAWFLAYASVLVFLHHLVLFYMEVFRFTGFFITLSRVLVSTVATMILIILAQFIFLGYRK